MDIDALSVNGGLLLGRTSAIHKGAFRFSVDPFATGVTADPLQPNLASEAQAMEAAADVILNVIAMPAGPQAPGAAVAQRGSTDGDGLRSSSGFMYPGLGLIEPCPPVIGNPAFAGDNLDALVYLNTFVPTTEYYFSLEGTITDPLTGVAAAGSAASHGFEGGDVLFFDSFGPGGTPTLFAGATSLGLDLVQGPGSDDLDALEVYDFSGGTADGIFEAPTSMHGWVAGAGDLVLFSVRRGSAVIGMPDSNFGLPIEEGDILMPPLPGSSSPYPGIYYSAEWLGMATVRSGTASGAFGDDLDALGAMPDLLHDCNYNTVEDVIEIGEGLALDSDRNGAPDECQLVPWCSPANINSTGLSTTLVGTIGNAVGSGAHLEAIHGPPNQLGYFLVGTGIALPGLAISQGVLCLGIQAPNVIGRYNVAGTAMNSIGVFDAFGTLQNFAGTSASGSGFDVPIALPSFGGTIAAGDRWNFQLWHRDLGGQSNFSDVLRVTF